VNLLLDSQVVVLQISAPHTLPAAVDAAILDTDNRVAISAASIWELAVKEASGKLSLPRRALESLYETEFELLDITPADGIDAARLPRHHGDPFDRILIAQARSRGLTLVGADARFSEYDVDVLWG
jgi:PIN domain nuclease of toxin-antitoxin system